MKYISHLAITGAIALLICCSPGCKSGDTAPTASIPDSSSIFAINHIGLTVRNLDQMLAFYQAVTGYELLDKQVVSNDQVADQLLGVQKVSYKRAILQAPNILFELTEFLPAKDTLTTDMPPQGPGMTHTCFQSPSWNAGYDKFIKQGIRPLSRGDHPIDLGGYGVTYAYAYDPEGNMLELEQLDQAVLSQAGRDSSLVAEHPLWMTQVALLSPNLDRLTTFYEQLLGKAVDRRASLANNPKLDSIANLNSLQVNAAWIKMDGPAKMMELMQYLQPATGPTKPQQVTDLGYHFSYETEDIQGEYLRMQEMGVELISEPQEVDAFLTFYARDVDGNLFAVREAKDLSGPYTVKNFVFTK